MGNANYPDIHMKVGSVKINVNMKRIRRNQERAQFVLDTIVMQDMIPYMPMQTGAFINRTLTESNSTAGSGHVCAGANPQGRFLYYGKVMVGEDSRSAYAKLGEKKVLTKKPLTYANGRGPFWFEEAKKRNMKRWEKAVRKEITRK